MSAVWPTKKLREIADIRVSNVDKKTYPSEKPVKLCNYMDVYSNDYVTGRIDFMEASATQAEIERFGLKSGDVIITKDSETPDDIGIPTVITEEIAGLVCGYHLALIRPDAEELDSIYLAKQLSTSQVTRYFSLHASGSTRYGLPVGAIESLEIPTPPVHEQTKIAEILSTVDRAIEQTEALIAKQQRLKTGLMQDLLTRGIDEHGNLRSEQTHKFKDSPLGRIPVEWECLRLEQMTRADSPITYGVVQPGNEDENGVRFLRGGDVYGGEIHQEKLRTISRTVSSSYKRTILEGGELVMSLVGYPGEVAVIPPNLAGSNLARQVALIRLAVEYDANFVMYYLMSVHGKRQVFGSTLGSAQQVVNLKDLRTVLIPLPKPKEQAMIRQKIDGSFLEFKAQTRSLAKLRSLKTALMQDLLTGRKRVTELLNNLEVPI